MSGLEIFGAAALYVVIVCLTAVAALGASAFWFRKGGLEVIPLVIIPPILVCLLGIAVGLVLLGRALA